jgi:hypothetical protein
MPKKYRGTKEYHLVYAELITAARYRGTVLYQEIAEIMGLPLTGSFMGRELGVMLGEISEAEVSERRPMLSAIVVSTMTGKPREGFFKYARGFGRLQDDDEWDFWEKEKEEVYTTWRKALKDG